MFRFVVFLILCMGNVVAQHPNIIQTDSVTIYRVHPGYKFLKSKLPKGALFLPRLSQRRVVRETALVTGIPVAVGIGLIAYDAKYGDPDEFIPFGLFMGSIMIAETLIFLPSVGNWRYQDKKRGYLGLAMRIGGVAAFAKENKAGRIVGTALLAGGTAYSFLSIPLSKRDYRAKLRRYGINE